MAAIYRRERIEGKGWRYVRVNLGRGRRPAEAPPYYVRFTINGKRNWSDPYDTLKDAQEAAGTLPDVIAIRGLVYRLALAQSNWKKPR